ncbi:MAG: aldose 1-epimerase family protein [Kiritimatiellaceae bacterium]|nr:aldose 1-epimerase family protein [Kiritimatiellaceae bacterium]
MRSIANKFLTIGVKEKGAELCSIRDSGGTEYMWQADPAFWARHAPVLFPVVGRLLNGRYELNGKTFELPPHGFARDMEFSLVEQSEHSLVFQLLPTAETRARYPFEFALNIIYRLNVNSLEISYEVRNNGVERMPFSIGAHPAFNLHGPVDECFLELEKAETLNTHLVSSHGLIRSETAPVLENSSIIQLTETLFDQDALVFMDMKSEKITLGAKHHSRRLTVEFPGFPQLGIWSKPGAPFVCIEPWYGYADPEQPYGDIMKKPGIQYLGAGETFVCTHRISIQ